MAVVVDVGEKANTHATETCATPCRFGKREVQDGQHRRHQGEALRVLLRQEQPAGTLMWNPQIAQNAVATPTCEVVAAKFDTP